MDPSDEEMGYGTHHQGGRHRALPDPQNFPGSRHGQHRRRQHQNQVKGPLHMPEMQAEPADDGPHQAFPRKNQHIGNHLQRDAKPQKYAARRQHHHAAQIRAHRPEGKQPAPPVNADVYKRQQREGEYRMIISISILAFKLHRPLD